MSSSKKSSPIKVDTTSKDGKFVIDSPVDDMPLETASTVSSSTPVELSGMALMPCKHMPAVAEFLKAYLSVASECYKKGADKCVFCRSYTVPMLRCLICETCGCWAAESSNHLQDHASKTGHGLALEVVSGTVYCAVCKCWVWTEFMKYVWEAVQRGESDSLVIRWAEILQGENADALKVCATVRGLYNLGNTCYMNSVLQMLVHTVPFKRYFLDAVRPHICNKDGCIACELDGIFCSMFDGKTSPLAPYRLLTALWKSSRDLAGYDQQDAHELFVSLRDALHHDLGGTIFNCECIVHRLFAGVLQSDVTCGTCGHVAETLDPFLDISLDLPANTNPVRLETCLQSFTKTESLAAGSFLCAGCHTSGSEIEKRLSIRCHPTILVIHLKRFDGAAKIDTPVIFPSQLYEEGTAYQLYASISHVGTLDSGHYTSYVSCRDEWFFVDDACVMACTEADVHNSNAYMIFYIKQ